MKIIDYLKLYDIKDLSKIRLGNRFDGGYVVPYEMLSSFTNCITYGVDHDVSFEVDLQKHNNSCQFDFYDPTVCSLPLNSPSNSNFFKKWISTQTLDDKITPHDTISSYVSGQSNVLLKCDIEGSEYGSIQTLTEDDINHIDCLVIEIHEIYENYQKCKELLEFISRKFTLFHIHGNNYGKIYVFDNEYIPQIQIPSVLELTYVNNKYADVKTLYNGPLPILGLDYPNQPMRDECNLQFLRI